MTQQRLRLLVLPEDSGVDGFATIKTVVRHLLEYIEPNGVLWKDEGRDHEWIDPRTREELTLVHAAAWKVERPSDPALTLLPAFSVTTVPVSARDCRDGRRGSAAATSRGRVRARGERRRTSLRSGVQAARTFAASRVSVSEGGKCRTRSAMTNA